jgi:hypothetical protein
MKKRIEELKGKSVEPSLSIGDATKEAMAVAMANQIGEALASISSEGRGIIDVLCGRYTNGSSDEDFYTPGTPAMRLRLTESRGQQSILKPHA